MPFVLLALNLARLRAWIIKSWLWIRPPLFPVKRLAWSGLDLSQLFPLDMPKLQVRANDELKVMNLPVGSPDHVDQVEVFHPEPSQSISATLRRKKMAIGDVESGAARGVPKL